MGELSAPQRNARRTGDFRPFGATRTGWGRGRKINQARAAGCQVPIVRPERSRVAPVRGVLNDSCPNLRQWSDRVGFVVREGRGSFRLLPLPGTRVGPFRDSGADFGTSEPRLPSDLLLPATADSYPLAGPVGTAGRGLVASENRADLFSELLAALPPSERLRHTEQRVGVAHRTLGMGRRRIGGDPYCASPRSSPDPPGWFREADPCGAQTSGRTSNPGFAENAPDPEVGPPILR